MGNRVLPFIKSAGGAGLEGCDESMRSLVAILQLMSQGQSPSGDVL